MKLSFPLVLLTLIASACSGSHAPSWTTDLTNGSETAAGLAVPLDDQVTLRFGSGCGQLEVGDRRTPCSQSGAGASMTAALRVGDSRIVWAMWNTGSDPLVDHAVVWSNQWPNGRRGDVYRSGSVQQMAWVMADGEEPWGVQLIDDRGQLVRAFDLVGLPGE